MDYKFTIINENTRQYTRFHTLGTQFTVRLLHPPEGNVRDIISYFMASVTYLCEHILRNCDDSNMVGISIRNEVNMRDKAIGIIVRLKDHFRQT